MIYDNNDIIPYWKIEPEENYYKKQLSYNCIKVLIMFVVMLVIGAFLRFMGHILFGNILMIFSILPGLGILFHIKYLFYRRKLIILFVKGKYIEIDNATIAFKIYDELEPELINIEDIEKVFYQFNKIELYLITRHFGLITKQKKYDVFGFDKKEVRRMVKYLNHYIHKRNKS